MADLVLLNQLPLGWIDEKQEERFRLEVGDLVTLLSRAFGTRWRFNLLSKKIELDNKPIPVFELENLYCHLSQRGYSISKDKAFDAARAAAMANSYHLSVNTWTVLRQTTPSFPLILTRSRRCSGTPMIRCTTPW